jgi:hypothetical protein
MHAFGVAPYWAVRAPVSGRRYGNARPQGEPGPISFNRIARLLHEAQWTHWRGRPPILRTQSRSKRGQRQTGWSCASEFSRSAQPQQCGAAQRDRYARTLASAAIWPSRNGRFPTRKMLRWGGSWARYSGRRELMGAAAAQAAARQTIHAGGGPARLQRCAMTPSERGPPDPSEGPCFSSGQGRSTRRISHSRRQLLANDDIAAAVRWRVVLVMAESERPQPRRPNRRGCGLHDATDHGQVGEHVEVVVVPPRRRKGG